MCVLAADIAGELLRERMDQAKAKAKADRLRRPTMLCGNIGEPGGRGECYFAKRMAPLVDDDGGRARIKQDNFADAQLVTFFNKQLRSGYVEMVQQIRASRAMAELSVGVVFEADGEVKSDAATTDDSRMRYETAMETTYALYPLLWQGGKLAGCPLPRYDAFRSWVRLFLMVYKEFFLLGEIVYEEVPNGADGPRTAKRRSTFACRVRGSKQRDTRERQYAFWSDQLSGCTFTQLKRRVAKSRSNRATRDQMLASMKGAAAQTQQARNQAKQIAKGPSSKRNGASGGGGGRSSGGRSRGGGVGAAGSAKRRGGGGAGEATGRGTSSEETGDEGDSTGQAIAAAATATAAAAGAATAEAAQAGAGELVEGDSMSEEDRYQKRNADFNYTLVEEAPAESYFSTVMLKEGKKPRSHTMKEEILLDDASDNVAQFVSIATSASGACMYIDVKSLTNNLHGKQDGKERKECRDKAEERGIANLSIPGGNSYLSRDANVLYSGTPEFERFMGDFGWDLGSGVQGMYQMFPHLPKKVAEKMMDGQRGNLQYTFGISNHNYSGAKPAKSGEVAALDVQGEKYLHKYFPNRGSDLGDALAKLGEMRDTLDQLRGGTEYQDVVRNQIFSGRTGQMFGRPTVGFENATLSLTGNSRTLREMVDMMIEKLDVTEQTQARATWNSKKAVETEDHGDSRNPEDDGDGYSRVVLGKWRMHLERDEEGEVLDMTLIGNHRSSAATHRAKMRGIVALADYIGEQFEARAEEEGYTNYDADGDFLAHGSIAVTIGFVEDAVEGIAPNSISKFGPGGFVSYSRAQSPKRGPWRRHRQEKRTTERKRRRRSQAGGAVDGHEGRAGGGGDDGEVASESVPEREVAALPANSTVHGELLMKRADFHRFADLSSGIWVIGQLRDEYELNSQQARELALCMLWHTRSRAVFLLKCQTLLRRDHPLAKEFLQFAKGGRRAQARKPGAVGSYVMNMVDPKRMGRIASEFIRATNFHLVQGRDGGDDWFTADYVALECEKMRKLLREAEKLSPQTSTAVFLKKHRKTVNHIGPFVLPQVLPIHYLLDLCHCDVARAAEAPILASNKEHYKKFLELGVEEKHMDLSMLVVALQYGLTPNVVENTGCETTREQENVHDFMLAGQLFYTLRPVPGCNYRRPDYQVYVKKWGPEGKWVPAVRQNGRWRHP